MLRQARRTAGYPSTILYAAIVALAAACPVRSLPLEFRVESLAAIPVGPSDSVFHVSPTLAIGVAFPRQDVAYRLTARFTRLAGRTVPATTTRAELLAGVALPRFLGFERASMIGEVGAGLRGFIEGYPQSTITFVNARRDTTWERLGQGERLVDIVARIGLEYRIRTGRTWSLHALATYQGNYQVARPAGTPLHTRSDNSIQIGVGAVFGGTSEHRRTR